MEELFKAQNFVALIPFRKKLIPLGAKKLESMADFLIWYTKDISRHKYNQLYIDQDTSGKSDWPFYEDGNGNVVKMTGEEINNPKLLPGGARIFKPVWQKPPTFSESNEVLAKLRKTVTPAKAAPPMAGQNYLN